MGGVKVLVLSAGIAATLSLQSCAFLDVPPDSQVKHVALERWNRCLERFESKVEHFCDGHRRDVLNAYPVYLENQLDALLSHQMHLKRARQLVASDSDTTSNIRDRTTPSNFTAIGGEAQNSDL